LFRASASAQTAECVRRGGGKGGEGGNECVRADAAHVRADASVFFQVTSLRMLQCVQVTDDRTAIVRSSVHSSVIVRVTTLPATQGSEAQPRATGQGQCRARRARKPSTQNDEVGTCTGKGAPVDVEAGGPGAVRNTVHALDRPTCYMTPHNLRRTKPPEKPSSHESVPCMHWGCS
jgi:hypothetical protein